MSKANAELVELFRTKAAVVGAKVVGAASMAEAARYVADVCESKDPCELLADEPDAEQGPLGPDKVPTRVKRIVAAPDLDDEAFGALAEACEAKGFACIRDGLRKHLAGIDVGVAQAVLGVADSGTCMVNSDGEEVRLATMISEISVLILRASAIRKDLPSIAADLRKQQSTGQPSYTAFITGPSRTADIERVSAIGVHGPLELHIILLEDQAHA